MPLYESMLKQDLDIVGFKETYRGPVYGEGRSNHHLLLNYLQNGFELIPIVRNPIWVLESTRLNLGNQWLWDLNGFLESFTTFLEFVGNTQPVVYELLVVDAKSQMKKAGVEFCGLKPMLPSIMGDEWAKKSSELSVKDRGIMCLGQDEISIIRASKAYSYWKHTCN
jgi:hypothetical protein